MDFSLAKHRIKFYTVPTIQDEYGSQIEATPVELRETWATVTPLSSFSSYNNSGLINDETFRFEVRYSKVFTPNKTLVIGYQGKLYNISEVIQPNEARDIYRITGVRRS